MKKLLISVLVFLTAFTAFAVTVLQTPSTVLYFLNWGEYIDHDLVEEFEKEYNCQVIEEDVTSSEAMYQKITANTTGYDVAVPGDYTVHQLYSQGYLRELDVTDPELTFLSQYQTMFNDDLKGVMNEYMTDETTGKEFSSYYMPYFWGAYSLIYSTRKEDVGNVIKENGFSSLYNRSLFKEDVSIGMYDTARWIVASYFLSRNENPNLTDRSSGSKEGALSTELKNEVKSALKEAHFNQFGNDQLKRNVANGSLDFCFTQLGDFFDTLYLIYSESDDEIQFNVSVPETTAAFFDSMVIPKNCQNYKLANQFINFMMNPDNAYQNARSIGYSPTLKSVASLFESEAEKGEYYYKDDSRSLTLSDFLNFYPMYLDPLSGVKNRYLFEPRTNDYLTSCEMIFNTLA